MTILKIIDLYIIKIKIFRIIIFKLNLILECNWFIFIMNFLDKLYIMFVENYFYWYFYMDGIMDLLISIFFLFTTSLTFLIIFILSIFWSNFLHFFINNLNFFMINLCFNLKVILLYKFSRLCKSRFHFIFFYFPYINYINSIYITCLLINNFKCLILSYTLMILSFIMD